MLLKPNISSHKNFEFLSNFSWFVPNIPNMVVLFILLCLGALIGNLVSITILHFFPNINESYIFLINYPILFILPMLYAKVKSNINRLDMQEGVLIDSSNFGETGGVLAFILGILLVYSFTILIDPINSIMPPMPEWMVKMLQGLTNGNILTNFICVSIMAPFFEEWLCRGMILRGLLNFKHNNKRGIPPIWAIIISALFFAFIHLNPWQAIPAFIMGVVFGFVYYKTGSLKLTMFMHFVNNTTALALSQLDFMKDDQTLYNIVPLYLYLILIILSVVIAVFCIKKFQQIDNRNNFNILTTEDKI